LRARASATMVAKVLAEEAFAMTVVIKYCHV
jgi:hypothetical protein